MDRRVILLIVGVLVAAICLFLVVHDAEPRHLIDANVAMGGRVPLIMPELFGGSKQLSESFKLSQSLVIP